MSQQESSQNESPPLTTPTRRPPEIDTYVDAFLSLLCDKSRRYILELLTTPNSSQTEDDEIKVPERRSGEIAKLIGLSPAATSEHLRQLLNAELITSRRDGTGIYYRIKNRELVEVFQKLIDALDKNYALSIEQQKQR
jgi:DNA-binding transcriptional ArsR family regulator